MAVSEVYVLIHEPIHCVTVTPRRFEPGIVSQAVPSTAVASGTGDLDVSVSGARRRGTSRFRRNGFVTRPISGRSIANQQHVGDRQILRVGECNQ
jgi:hypothetical protein